MFGLLDHRGAHRVEFDIPVGGQQVAIRVDQAGFEAPFSQGSGASMAAVECGDIGLSKLAHGQRHLTGFPGADEQVHVVAHEDIGVDFQPMFRGAFGQQTQIVAAVVVIQKDGASIDSALRDVERYTRNFQASLAWHEQSR